MSRFSGPEKIKLGKEGNSEKEDHEEGHKISLSSVAEVFSSKEKISEEIDRDARTIGRLIKRVREIEESNTTARETNEINKKRARIQDIISGHFIKLKTIPRDITEVYLPALIDSIHNDEQARYTKELLEDHKFVNGIKSHAKSILRACQHRKEQEVSDSDMKPFTTMYIGASELLDASYKIDYCNLRWMPTKSKDGAPHLRLDLVQAKTTFPVASEGDPMEEAKLITSQHERAARKFLSGPKFYEDFEDIKSSLKPLIASAFFDVTGGQTANYQEAPENALFDTVLAKNFPAVFRGETSEVDIESVGSKEVLDTKEDLRALLILQKELEEKPDIVLKKFEDLVNAQVGQYGVPEELDMDRGEIEGLVRSAFLNFVSKLNPETLLTEQPIEVYSVIDAAKSRVVVKTNKEGEKEKQDISRYEQNLTNLIDKESFGMYFIETETLADLVREHEVIA